MSVETRGFDEFRRRLDALTALVARAGAAALYVEANALLTDSKKIVPVDLGALRSSGFVSPPEIDATGVTVTVGYGGPAAPYALPVHEIPPPPQRSVGGRSARHKPPTQWKYLETPTRLRAAGFDQRVGTAMRNTIEKEIGRGPAR